MTDAVITGEEEEKPRAPKGIARQRLMLRLLAGWVAVVTLYFLWEAYAYRGLYAMFAEWQFYRFGHYLPIVTFSLLVVLFAAPSLFLLRPRRARYRKGRYGAGGPDKALDTAMDFRRFLLAFSSGLGIAALATLFWSLTLPQMHPPERTITVGAADSATPAPGPAFLNGRVLYTRTSAFTQDMLVARRGARFAPVISPAGDDLTIRYFIELPPSTGPAPAATAPVPAPEAGVLMRNALPGSIVKLYGYAGYRIEQPYYVLYTSTRTMRWSYYITAAQLALAALIVLAAAFYQHRRVKRVETIAIEHAEAARARPNYW